MTGHLLGAAGGLEAASRRWPCTTRSCRRRSTSTTPDPECDLDYVPHTSRADADRYALSNSFGFGGTNAALLFKRYEAVRVSLRRRPERR